MNTKPTSPAPYLLFAGSFILAAFVILQSFLFGMLWGAVMAVSTWPLYERTLRPTRRWQPLSPSSSAALFAGLFVILFLGPVVYGVYELAEAYAAGATYVAENSVHGSLAPPELLGHLPFADKLKQLWLDNITESHGILDVLNRLTHGQVLAVLPLLWGKLMDKVLTVVVMLVSLYFMLKHGQIVKTRYVKVLSDWTGERGVRYADAAIEALRGTINGVVLVGAVEGILLAIPLMLGGVRAGLLIGLVAGLLGVIPLLMPLLVLPCLGYLYLAGQTTWALIGALDLALVWFVCENMVKPAVINQRVRINTWFILMALVGGLQLFGLVGLFLGPAVVAVALGMLQDLLQPSPDAG